MSRILDLMQIPSEVAAVRVCQAIFLFARTLQNGRGAMEKSGRNVMRLYGIDGVVVR